MKVCFLTREFTPYIYGGAGVHIKYLAQEMSKIMDVEVKSFGDQRVNRKHFKVKGYSGWNKMNKPKDRRFKNALKTISINLEAMADGIDADIVHTHTWYAHLGGLFAKTLYNIPFVATSHSLEPLRPWKVDQLGNAYHLSSWIEKIGLESADKVVGVSKDMAADIMKYFDVPKSRTTIIHNGIDLDKWNYTEITDKLKKRWGIKDDYVLFIGRPTAQKGMEYLVEAADQIGVQVVFEAVGADTKEYEDRLKKKVAKKKNIVWITKVLKEEENVQLYSSAKVFICPSVYEPFGITNLEAMATNTPVVATAVGGIKEVVIPGKTGILIKPRKPNEIADAVNSLLKNPTLAKKYGKAGRIRAEKHFSWASIAKKTKKMYETLLKKKK